MNLEQNVELFLSVTTASPVNTEERNALVGFLSQKESNSNKYAIYKGEQSYFFEDDKLVNCGTTLPLKNMEMAYRFDGISIVMQELPEMLVCFGGDSNKPKKNRGNGSFTNNNNNNNNNNG